MMTKGRHERMGGSMVDLVSGDIFLGALTCPIFRSPLDHPEQGSDGLFEFGTGQADRLDEGRPGNGIFERQEDNVMEYEVAEILMNHDTTIKQGQSDIF